MNEEAARALGEGFAKGLVTGATGTILLTALAGSLVWLWFRYPNNARLVVAQIWDALSWIFGSFAERRYLVNHLEGKVGRSIELLNSRVDGLDAEQVKIDLVTTTDREAFIRDRVLVMRLQKKSNHGKNLANVAMMYSQHLYAKIDPSLNFVQREAVKLFTAMRILKTSGPEGVREMNDMYYRPIVTKHPNIQQLLNKLERIDNRGLFYGVFIQELVFLGNKVLFRPKARGVAEEVSRFVQFLENFAERARGDESVDMDFRSLNIKVSFVLVAIREKREAEETQSYIRRVEQLLPRDTESFYLMGWGENLRFVRQVAREIAEKLSYIEVRRELEYDRYFKDGKRLDAICILARNRRQSNFVEPPLSPVTQIRGPSAQKGPSLPIHKK